MYVHVRVCAAIITAGFLSIPGRASGGEAAKGLDALAEHYEVVVPALPGYPGADGLHLLELHVPAFGADAAPSRPVLYPVSEATP